MARDYHFLFTVLGRYPARVEGNLSNVSVNLAAGRGDHFVHCGTLTMNEEVLIFPTNGSGFAPPADSTPGIEASFSRIASWARICWSGSG